MFFYLVVYDKKFPVKTLLKKRYTKYPVYPKLKFGCYGITFLRNIRFEYVYLFYIRKFLKKTLKKNKKFYRSTKAWIFIRPNHVMTKKSKNARMGKGKGSFIRWCTLIQKGFIFAEFNNISYIRLNKAIYKLQNKIKVPLKIVYKASTYKLQNNYYLGVVNHINL